MIRKAKAAAVGGGQSDGGEGWKTKGGVEGDGAALEGRGLVGDREEGGGGGSEQVSRSRHEWKA